MLNIKPAIRHRIGEVLGNKITKIGHGCMCNGAVGRRELRMQVQLGGRNIGDAIGLMEIVVEVFI